MMTFSSIVPILTIWVHGTFPQDFIPQNIAHIRPLKYIKNHYYCPPGLSKVKDIGCENMYSRLMHSLAEHDETLFPLENLYLFGWSGKLSSKDRIEGGRNLYRAIKKIVREEYQGTPPFIRIIAHSHGGNVALNMASLFEEENPGFFINELIMLGTPVQQATIPHTKSPLFKQIFNIHSHADIIQIGDPQGLPGVLDELRKLLSDFSIEKSRTVFSRLRRKPFFSRRHFPLLENLHNIRMQLDGRDVFHIEYITEGFFGKIPAIVHVLEGEKSPYLKNHEHGDLLLNLPKN